MYKKNSFVDSKLKLIMIYYIYKALPKSRFYESKLLGK